MWSSYVGFCFVVETPEFSWFHAARSQKYDIICGDVLLGSDAGQARRYILSPSGLKMETFFSSPKQVTLRHNPKEQQRDLYRRDSSSSIMYLLWGGGGLFFRLSNTERGLVWVWNEQVSVRKRYRTDWRTCISFHHDMETYREHILGSWWPKLEFSCEWAVSFRLRSPYHRDQSARRLRVSHNSLDTVVGRKTPYPCCTPAICENCTTHSVGHELWPWVVLY
jgi:hypothetical protein